MAKKMNKKMYAKGGMVKKMKMAKGGAVKKPIKMAGGGMAKGGTRKTTNPKVIKGPYS
jgi:hypothetical protein